MAFLKVKEIRKVFGGVVAVDNVSVLIEKGEILGMIGPNGSGKSTFINLLSGIYKPDGGAVTFGGEDITGLPAHIVTKKGIARTFQNLRVFQGISVLSNVLIGRHCHVDYSLFTTYLNPFLLYKKERELKEKVIKILELASLDDKIYALAKNLSYGEQRLLEICRAVASDPAILLLDEPCAGMNPVEMTNLAIFLRKLRDTGTTIFIIEHNMKFIMSFAERIVVLDAGKNFREGLPAEIQGDEGVQRIYLGDEEEM